MMKSFFLLGMVLILLNSSLKAQQLPQFSQYIFNGLHINPGYAGYKGEPYIQSTYRSQWLNFPGSPSTFSLTADLSANEGTMGFGLSILSDEIGPTNTFSGMLTYAYRIQLGKESFLGLGASFGISEYKIDGSLLDPNDPNDPEIPDGTLNMFTPNLNSGLFFHTPTFYAGFSVFNMIGRKSLEREDLALAYHDFHYFLTFGALFNISDQVAFKPNILFKEVKGAPTNVDTNVMFLFYERIWLGAAYRSNLKIWNENLQGNLSNRNAIAGILEVFMTDRLRLGYAYDHNLNVLQDFRSNSHEFSLGFYMIPRKAVMKNPRWF
ncbi:PorP/SprF family type IX secretion system membrane protein [Algoriphagus marincola]|uniref:PorP/SprF family type IX secretion system membrane protein n=1 Tax=Algoriphagus marincola TaxID=264027 RepID=UPI0005572190